MNFEDDEKDMDCMPSLPTRPMTAAEIENMRLIPKPCPGGIFDSVLGERYPTVAEARIQKKFTFDSIVYIFDEDKLELRSDTPKMDKAWEENFKNIFSEVSKQEKEYIRLMPTPIPDNFAQYPEQAWPLLIEARLLESWIFNDALYTYDESDWILRRQPGRAENNKNYLKFRGKCKEFSTKLCERNPELILVRGWYTPIASKKEQHWWCKSPDGQIIDITRLQFPCCGQGEYEEFDGTVECEQCGKSVPEKDIVAAGNYPVCSHECYGRLVGLL